MRYLKRALLLIIALALASLFAFRLKEALEAQKEVRPQGTRRPPAPLVETLQVQQGKVTESLDLLGTLKPKTQVQVLPKVGGRIEQLLVDTGHRVQKGTLIAKIEDDEIEQEIYQAEAALEMARAQLRQREAEVLNLESQSKRLGALYEEALISRQELEQIQTQYRSARAQVDVATAQIRQAEAVSSRLQIQLQNTQVFAPMDGFVAQRLVDPGQLVSPNTPLVTLVGLKPMVARASVVEKDLPRVKIGLPAAVFVDAYPGRSFGGRVARISPVLEAATRTGVVEIEVENPALELKPEMFARARVGLGTERPALLVPREGLVHRADQSAVFLLRSDTVKFQPVEVGVAQGEEIEIVAGLQEGDRIVTRGANLLKDGDRVQLRGQPGEGGQRGASRAP